MKVAVYSFTPGWVAGIFQIIPLLGVLTLLGGLYGLYLLYLGLPRLMKCPEDKAVGYAAVVVICAIVVSVVITSMGGLVVGAGAAGAGLFGGGGGNAPAADVTADPDSALGRLQQLGRGLEQSAANMEAAEKSGDQGAQAAAALEGLGTLFGGGKRVDPLSLDQLKVFVPETFAGMPRRSTNAERTGLGVMVSKAEATYGDGEQREVALEVLDTGGASGLMGLASWMGVQQERESDDGFERTSRVDGRLVHEQMSKSSGTSEFSVVLGDRFVVNAKGRGVDVDALKAGVSGLNLSELEAMKDVGVQN